jgi:hypothetical protein
MADRHWRWLQVLIMSGCSTNIANIDKACSGKCKSAECRNTLRVWVVAACEGMVSLFEKDANGSLSLVGHGSDGVFHSLEDFQKSIGSAERTHAFDKLVIIGSRSDLAWIQALLPVESTRHIAAEIEYPLLPGWFKQPLPQSGLASAIEKVFAS